MPTKRMRAKHWKMFVILVLICTALLLLRWAAMVFG
ncbi:small membrane protein YniD [Serratia sp. L9]